MEEIIFYLIILLAFIYILLEARGGIKPQKIDQSLATYLDQVSRGMDRLTKGEQTGAQYSPTAEEVEKCEWRNGDACKWVGCGWGLCENMRGLRQCRYIRKHDRTGSFNTGEQI